MRSRRIEPTAVHRAFRADMIEVLRKHGGTLTRDEILALAAHLVGQVLALQDQRTMTPQRAYEIIARNIEQGSAEVVKGLLDSRGSA